MNTTQEQMKVPIINGKCTKLGQKRKEAELLKWQQAYKESLEKHGSVSVDVARLIFVGPLAVGKSSLKHILVHNTPKAVKSSTAVMDTPEVVTISSEQYAIEGGTSAWQLVSNDVMGKSLYECVIHKAYDEDSELFHHVDESTEMKDSLHQPASIVSDEAGENRDSGGDSDSDSEVVDEMFAFSAGDMSVQLKNASFIHLIDTGGQPSFQDALPLLLDVPCTYIHVFNAARGLDQPVPITCRPDDHTEEVLPPSAETGWEMMLRSFSSMQTMAHKVSKELASFQQEVSQLPPFNVFVVGTFKDQLVAEGRLKEATQDISKHLKELRGKPYYSGIEKDTAGEPFFLINGKAPDEDDRAGVNSLREHLFTTRASFKLKVPIRWCICKQYTQGMSEKFIRFLDLKSFCLKHKFIDADGADEQFRSLLKMFSLLGFYTFFDLKDVPDEANYVCTDKGEFLKAVAKLLAVQFLHTPRCRAVEDFQQVGIISCNPEIFRELGIREEVDQSWFLAALQHLGLAACYGTSSTDSSPSYFMPAALPCGKTKLPVCSSMAALCVAFTFHSPDNPLVYTDLPRGVFCRVAVALSKGPWRPIPKESDRTTVKFQSEEFDLYLTEAPGFISLTPVLVEELEGKEPLVEVHNLCKRLYDTLHKSIVSSAVDVLGDQFSQTAKIVFGFECACQKVPHLATPSSAKGKTLICQTTHARRKTTNQEQIWFAPVEGAKIVEVDGCGVWTMKDIIGPSSATLQTGHLRWKVHAQESSAFSLAADQTLTADVHNDALVMDESLFTTQQRREGDLDGEGRPEMLELRRELLQLKNDLKARDAAVEINTGMEELKLMSARLEAALVSYETDRNKLEAAQLLQLQAVAERDNYMKKTLSLQKQLLDKEQEMHMLRKEAEVARKHYHDLKNEKESIADKQSFELEDLHSRISVLQSELESVKEEHDVLKIHRQLHDSDLRQMASDHLLVRDKLVTVVQEALDDMQKRMVHCIREFSCLESAQETVVEHVRAAEANFQTAEAEMRKLEREAERYRHKLLDLPHPTMEELYQRVVPTVAEKWRDIGSYLGIDGHIMRAVVVDQGSDDDSCMAVLSKWLDGAGKQPKTWTTVLEAMRRSGFLESAKELEVTIQSNALL